MKSNFSGSSGHFPVSRSSIATSTEGHRYTEEIERERKLECGPMPNLMVALPNIGGALCQRRSLADAHY